jgi:hypothetical protein
MADRTYRREQIRRNSLPHLCWCLEITGWSGTARVCSACEVLSRV